MSKQTKVVLCVLLTCIAPPLGLALLVITLSKDNKQSDDKKEVRQSENFSNNTEQQSNAEPKENYSSSFDNPKSRKISNKNCLTPRDLALKSNKKATIFLLIISIALAILSIVLENFGSEPLQTVGMFCMWGCFFGSMITLAGFLDRKRIKRSYCPYCGEKYDYEEDVSWEVSNVTVSDKGKDADVLFECMCGNCGETTNFTKRFRIAEYKNDGTYVEKNISVSARNYFK